MTHPAHAAISAVAKQTAARAAAKAYARRCSWVDVNDLESEAWVGILQAPPFDPTRAPALSKRKQATLPAEEQTRIQMHGFYFCVGIRWLSSYVARQGSPLSTANTNTNARAALHNTRGSVDLQTFSGPSVTAADPRFTSASPDALLCAADLSARITERITELVGMNEEDKIGAAFLLRDSEDLVADDIATLFGTTRRAVYASAERLQKRIRTDRKTMRLFADLVDD